MIKYEDVEKRAVSAAGMLTKVGLLGVIGAIGVNVFNTVWNANEWLDFIDWSHLPNVDFNQIDNTYASHAWWHPTDESGDILKVALIGLGLQSFRK